MENHYYPFFYEPSPFVEDTIKNMISIYEENEYPQNWDEFKSNLNLT